jgi:elongation factor Ts
MADYTAKDVQALRQASGAGMMDAKNALVETGGDMDAAKRLLREKGLGKAEARSDRENTQGVVAVGTAEGVVAIVELKSETDFVAKSDDFKALAQELADLVAADGEDAVAAKADQVDDMRVTLKENIAVGEVVRIEAGDGSVVDSYLHKQEDRGVNAVAVEISGATPELAHDIAVHIGFARPPFLSRDEVPADEVEVEREVLIAESRNEGKPEAALDKIVEGKLKGRFFQERVLLDQKFVKDEKQTITGLLGDAEVVRFAQVEIGG